MKKKVTVKNESEKRFLERMRPYIPEFVKVLKEMAKKVKRK